MTRITVEVAANGDKCGACRFILAGQAGDGCHAFQQMLTIGKPADETTKRLDACMRAEVKS